MKSKNNYIISNTEAKHLTKLANLKLTEKDLIKIIPAFSVFLDYVSKIKSLDTRDIEETSQVTGQENVFREDVVEEKRMLSQEEALSNSKKTHDGFFEVEAIF